MCQLSPQEITREMDNLEIPQDTDDNVSTLSENTYYYIMCVNEELQEIDNNKFMDPVELIIFMLNKLHLNDDPVEMYNNLLNLGHKISLLYIIVLFKETFDIYGKVDVIMVDFIKSVVLEEEKQTLALEFFNRYKIDVLTDLF